VAAGLYRGDALQAIGRLGDYWQACAESVRTFGVCRLSRPRDWSGLELLLDRLEADALAPGSF
jgi:hypothetical protein